MGSFGDLCDDVEFCLASFDDRLADALILATAAGTDLDAWVPEPPGPEPPVVVAKASVPDALPAYPPVPAALREAAEKTSLDVELMDREPVRWQSLRESFVVCGGMLIKCPRTDIAPLVIDDEPPAPAVVPPPVPQRPKRKNSATQKTGPRAKQARRQEGPARHPAPCLP